MMGAALGLKGGQLNNYVNNALNMQTTYGLDATQSQQLLGGGLGVGVGMNANMQGIDAIRALANNTQTSTAYANKGYLQGMTSAAGMGATAQAAVSMGELNDYFGKNNFAIQGASIYGNEASTTQLGQVFMAKALGTNYMNLFGGMRTATPDQLANAAGGVNTAFLKMAGIDPATADPGPDGKYASIYGRIKILHMILNNNGMTNITTDLDAYNWAVRALQSAKATAAGVAPAQQNPDHSTLTKTVNTVENAAITPSAINKIITNGDFAQPGTPARTAYEQLLGDAGLVNLRTGAMPNGGAIAMGLNYFGGKAYNDLNEQLDIANTTRYSNIGNPKQYKQMMDLVSKAGKEYQSGNYYAASKDAEQAIKIEVTLKGEAAHHLKTVVKNRHTGKTQPNGTHS
jgi:hypothetical protein